MDFSAIFYLFLRTRYQLLINKKNALTSQCINEQKKKKNKVIKQIKTDLKLKMHRVFFILIEFI